MGKIGLSSKKRLGGTRVHTRLGKDRHLEAVQTKIKRDLSLNARDLSKSASLVIRPGFSAKKKRASIIEASLATGKPASTLKPGKLDLAQPHRLPYTELRRIVFNSPNPTKRRTDIKKLLNASKEYEELFEKESLRTDKGISDERKSQFGRLKELYKKTREDVEDALRQFEGKKCFSNAYRLLKALNNLASNAPGLGPHREVNLPTLDRLHVMPQSEDEPEILTPRSRAAVEVSANSQRIATAVSKNQESILAPSGALFPLRRKRKNPLKRATEVVLRGYRKITTFKGSLVPRLRSRGRISGRRQLSNFLE